ncbi:hypothetical protein BGX29_006640 [Mortierella sp. GBA35]|nr:hypothetical protein BGX23_010242 [Mortierella sp. AD031]KAF9100389.1 hypothetical protein BGX29_006640 [Mortierella sp. GBA35]KAG0206199.1 hypothetical protein BGX33_007511 [Mortierella sp. NVP41]
MYARSLLTIVLLALCALCTFSSVVVASPPPPQSTDVLKVTSPPAEKTYKVGQDIHVKVELVGGKKNILYKDNTPIDVIIQKNIRYPRLNVKVASVPARTLATKGYKFKAKKEYLIKEQATVRFRIRTHFDHTQEPKKSGFSDSRGFYIVKK